jgi:hypothetical protein
MIGDWLTRDEIHRPPALHLHGGVVGAGDRAPEDAVFTCARIVQPYREGQWRTHVDDNMQTLYIVGR